MEKRKQKRIKIRQIAKIGGKLGVVNDISDNGIQVSTSLMPKSREIDISFEAYGKIIKFIGVIQWIKSKKKLQSLNEMGILVQDAPAEYTQFVKDFYA